MVSTPGAWATDSRGKEAVGQGGGAGGGRPIFRMAPPTTIGRFGDGFDLQRPCRHFQQKTAGEKLHRRLGQNNARPHGRDINSCSALAAGTLERNAERPRNSSFVPKNLHRMRCSIRRPLRMVGGVATLLASNQRVAVAGSGFITGRLEAQFA